MQKCRTAAVLIFKNTADENLLWTFQLNMGFDLKRYRVKLLGSSEGNLVTGSMEVQAVSLWVILSL